MILSPAPPGIGPTCIMLEIMRADDDRFPRVATSPAPLITIRSALSILPWRSIARKRRSNDSLVYVPLPAAGPDDVYHLNCPGYERPLVPPTPRAATSDGVKPV